jgi:predicted transcriptional regulator
MRIEEIIDILKADLLIGEELLMDSVDYGYSCDLMSDVLAFVQNNVLLLTGLVHPQVIRTAEMLDIKAILIVRGKTPSEEVLRMAKMRDIAIIATKHSLFTASGLLYAAGLKGEEITHNELTL